MPVNLLDQVIAGMPLVVVSAHPDDAVLSCGALMMHAAGRTQVTVVTLFTGSSRPRTRCRRAVTCARSGPPTR